MKSKSLLILFFLLVGSEVRPLPLGGFEFLLGGMMFMTVKSPRVQGYALARLSQTTWGKKLITRGGSVLFDQVRNRVAASWLASMFSVQAVRMGKATIFSRNQTANLYGKRPEAHIHKERLYEHMADFQKDFEGQQFQGQRVPKYTYTQATQNNVRAMGLYQKFIQGVDPEEYAHAKAQVLDMENQKYKYWFQGFLGGFFVLTVRDWLLKKEERDQHIHTHESTSERATRPMFLNPEQYRYLNQ